MTPRPFRPGRPRSSSTRSGCSVATACMAASPVATFEHRVVAGAQVERERPPDLRLVVDHEDLAHTVSSTSAVASGSTIVAVSPPPGCVVEHQPALHRTDEPVDDREPETHPVGTGVVEPLERRQHLAAPVDRDAGAAVDDAHVEIVADRGGGHGDRRARGRVAARVVDQVGDRALEQRPVGEDGRQVGWHVDGDRFGPVREAPHRRVDRIVHRHRHELHGERARLEPARIEQVPDQPVEPVGLLVDRGVHLGQLRRLPDDRWIEQPRRERLDRGERRAEVVRHGAQQRRACPVDRGELVGAPGVAAHHLPVDRNPELTGECGEHPLVVGGQRATTDARACGDRPSATPPHRSCTRGRPPRRRTPPPRRPGPSPIARAGRRRG